MNSRSSSKMSRLVACGSRIARRLIACAALIIPLTINAATAAPEEEVRATFDRFVAAQKRARYQGRRVPVAGHFRFPLDHPRHSGLGV
jgi:hypothetical protein